jgi:hypothetical protein
MTEHDTTAALAGQSLANSAAIAVSDATTALRNVQAIMTTVQSVAMARWLASGERDETFMQIVNAATQIERDAVRLWQEIQATAQTVIGAEGLRPEGPHPERTDTNPSPVRKSSARRQPKARKKVARKAAKPAVAKRVSAAKKPTKPASKKVGKKAPAKRAKPRAKPVPTPAPTPPIDVVPTEES